MEMGISPCGEATTAFTAAVPSTVAAPAMRSDCVMVELTVAEVLMGERGVGRPTTCVCDAFHTTEAVIGWSPIRGYEHV
ncbi:hypothetical protein LIU39_08070 [Streptomyces sp. SF28]|nr:hypothetical protein [Streptomyces pinistramenti]MCB5907368.1 hypothetical protein [Streptomyces pinistramenti]